MYYWLKTSQENFHAKNNCITNNYDTDFKLIFKYMLYAYYG